MSSRAQLFDVNFHNTACSGIADECRNDRQLKSEQPLQRSLQLSVLKLSVAKQLVHLPESGGTDAAELHHWLQLQVERFHTLADRA